MAGLTLVARLSSAMPAFSSICAIWGAAHVALCQPVGAIRRDNAQLNQTIDVSQVDPGIG